MLATSEILIENGQQNRLANVVSEMLARIPLYQSANYPRSDAGLEDAAAFRNLPFIIKGDLRVDFPNNFLGENADLDELIDNGVVELEHTAGTSEERTPLLLKKGWWIVQEERALRLNSFVANTLDANPGARRITINSPTCNNDINYTTVPSRDERIVGNSLSLSLSRHPFLWSEDELERMAEEAVEWNPVFLDVDPVYGVVFARYCERHGIKLPSLRFILCSYEYVSVVHRRILARVFGVPVFNLYGATETGHLLMEDENGRLIPSQETAYLEVVQEDSRNTGKLVATTLTNEYMPLLRYQLGDLASVHHGPLQTNYIVYGREKDSIKLPSGVRVTTRDVDQCFAEIPGIAHYQLIQKSAEKFQLRYAPDTDAPVPSDLQKLQERLSAILQLAEPIELNPTDLLLPEGSGKFRLMVPLKVG